MTPFCYFCLQLSAIGLAASALVQLGSWFGDGILLEGITVGLLAGVLLLFVPVSWATVALKKRLGFGWFTLVSLSTLWGGCPRLMHVGTLAIWAYGVLSMGALVVADWVFPGLITLPSAHGRLFCWLGSAGMLMVYSLMVSTFYAVLYTDDAARECPNGHPVFRWSKCCGECGAEIAKPGSKASA